MCRLLVAIGVVVSVAAPAAAQVTCPAAPVLAATSVAFTASPDHHVLDVNGVALVTTYVGGIYIDGTSVPTQTLDFGKPQPDATNTITLPAVLPQTLTKGQRYCLRVDAVGPGGVGSAPPVAFGFPLAAPTGVSVH